MKKIIRNLVCVIIAIILVLAGILVNFVNRAEQTHTILSIDKIEATEGDSEGFYTRIYYQVSTDKGAYHIRTSGLNAAPQCAGIKKDSSYVLVTRGVSVPIIGVYQCIIDVKEDEK